MRNTLVPARVVVTLVKILKDRKTGWYILTSQLHELGRMATAPTREILTKIAAKANLKVVRTWA